jgi:hypothetical protein
VNRAPAAATLRRLAPLTVAVLALHVLLLQPEGEKFTAPASASFHTRTISIPPPPPPAQVLLPAPVGPPAPAPVVRPRPAPRAPIAPITRVAAPEIAAASPVAPTTSSPPPAAPVSVLPALRLHYEVEAQARGLTFKGQAELTWRHDGQAYEARLEASTPGRPSRVQRSVGRLTGQGLVPDYFSDKSRSEQATHFDREKQRLVFSNNKPEAALAEGTQDRLSVVLQLASLVAGSPQRYVPGATITLPTTGTSDADHWIFSVEREEDLGLPGGEVRALKLQRLPRKEYDQKVELWLAPRMDYAPVRLRLTNPNGDAVDQRWSSTDRG